MIKYILLFILCLVKVAYSNVITPHQQAVFQSENIIRNPSAEISKVGWVTSNGTLELDNTYYRTGNYGFKFTATSANAFIETELSTVKNGSMGSCSAYVFYRTTASNATFTVYQGSTALVSSTLASSTFLTRIPNYFFTCNGGQGYKLRITTPTNGTVISFDDAFLGFHFPLSYIKNYSALVIGCSSTCALSSGQELGDNAGSDWLNSSITKNSTGNYSLGISANTIKKTPNCMCSINGLGFCSVSNVSTSSMTISTFNTSSTPTDLDFNIFCMEKTL